MLYRLRILTLRITSLPDSPLVTIEYFVPQLIVITSKQRPRKLTIHGSDGNDYAFLLKGHEDLRQDERVMQVCIWITSSFCTDLAGWW
jgi:phosphatidylinositol kinase/protein kinase (PI-3  family)